MCCRGWGYFSDLQQLKCHWSTIVGLSPSFLLCEWEQCFSAKLWEKPLPGTPSQPLAALAWGYPADAERKGGGRGGGSPKPRMCHKLSRDGHQMPRTYFSWAKSLAQNKIFFQPLLLERERGTRAPLPIMFLVCSGRGFY